MLESVKIEFIERTGESKLRLISAGIFCDFKVNWIKVFSPSCLSRSSKLFCSVAHGLSRMQCLDRSCRIGYSGRILCASIRSTPIVLRELYIPTKSLSLNRSNGSRIAMLLHTISLLCLIADVPQCRA